MALVGTKWHTPTPRRRLVPRSRLLDQLPQESGQLPRLILVCAPAGFGKTTLLAQWLTQWQAFRGIGSRHVAWLSLDSEDNDPARFLADLLASVRAAAPDVGVDATALLENDSVTTAQIVLANLVNDLDRREGSLVLALDDYQVIDSPQIHGAVAFLLDHLPDHVGLAVTTRADPELPVARLRARGELYELRATDLRFTRDEATAFLNDVMGLTLDPRHIDALEGRTEGWVAGLQLAALSLRNHDDPGLFIEEFTGNHRFVLDYLVEEVLINQSEQDRSFLLDTSILGRLTGPLCDALTGRADGRDSLEALERGNLFVIPLDDRRQWYRYHHLFADALRARLTAENPGRTQQLHRAAARWYAEQDSPEAALAHAVAGHDHEHAADLVERALPGAARRRQDRTIRTWLHLLPDDLVRRRPILNVTVAWSRLADGDLDEAAARLQDAATTLASMPATACAADDQLRQLPMTIAMYRAAIAQARADTAGAAEQARRILDLAGRHDHLARGAGFGFLGFSLWAEGELESAVETFTQCVRSLHASGNLADELGCTVVLAAMWWARGCPRESGDLHRRALVSARGRPEVALPVTADLHVGLAESLCERGDLDAAAEHLQTAWDLGETASLPENRHRWYVASAQLRRARGDLDTAADLLEQAEALYLPGFLPDLRPIPAIRARVDLARGRPDLARAWQRRVGIEADDLTRTAYVNECSNLTLARLLIAQQREGEATVLLDDLLSAAEGRGRDGSVIEILMLQALALQARRDVDAAMPPLVRALETGVPAGYARLFLDEGPPMEVLLTEVRRRNLAADAASRLSRTVAPASVTPASVNPASVNPADHGLSERELEVLRLLPTELTGPELARHLFVSINTLRTHTKRIFTKLDVSTRAAAVRRATDLGLI